jgi:Asp-tRNA(Asn)/Glu-tRNA(Gln) amidotransferase A subunit family amidase
MSDAIAYSSIRELGTKYRKRELSPVEVTKTLLARIEKLDPALHAFVTLTPDRALADARAAEEALRRGDERPLLGIPVGHKDIYMTRGIRTTGGSALFADWIPEQESTVVTKWAQAGTIMMGKLITHEFAFGLQWPKHRFPWARNPWNSRPACCTARRARTPAARSAGRPRSAASRASSRPTGARAARA